MNKRKEHKGIIATNEVDRLLAEVEFPYYFWHWDTLVGREVPLLEVYMGNVIDERHSKFRERMLELKVRVKFINLSGQRKK